MHETNELLTPSSSCHYFLDKVSSHRFVVAVVALTRAPDHRVVSSRQHESLLSVSLQTSTLKQTSARFIKKRCLTTSRVGGGTSRSPAPTRAACMCAACANERARWSHVGVALSCKVFVFVFVFFKGLRSRNCLTRSNVCSHLSRFSPAFQDFLTINNSKQVSAHWTLWV